MRWSKTGEPIFQLDQKFVEKTEDYLRHDRPPKPSSIWWSGRCRWLILLFVLVTSLGIWHQLWAFFVFGIGGKLGLLLAFLQFRLELRHLMPLQELGKSSHLLTTEKIGRADSDLDIGNNNILALIAGYKEQLSGARLQIAWQDGNKHFHAGTWGQLQLHLSALNSDLAIREVWLHHSAYLTSHQPLNRSESLILCKHKAGLHLIIELETPVIGKFRIHGVELKFEDRWRLFRTMRYVRLPRLLRVMPSIPLRHLNYRGMPLNVQEREQVGSPQKRVGTGMELRDIRDYRPGDARRNIVWKHSVRHRKLLCREFESESQMSSYLLLDIGSSMRQGELGRRPLDYASEVILAFAKSILAGHDALGLICFDSEIFRHEPTSNAPQQLQRILLHLEALNQIIDARFSDLSLNQIASKISGFLFHEQLVARDGGVQVPGLRQSVEYAWHMVWKHPDLQFPPHWKSDQHLIDSVLRTFCKAVGIELPYHNQQWNHLKSVGLQKSIDTASENLASGQMIVVISDFDDIFHWDGIFRSLKKARLRRQHLLFLCPFSPWFEDAPLPTSAKDITLRNIFTLEQWRRHKEIERHAAQYRIPLLSLDPLTSPAALLQRLQRLRQSARL